MPLVSPKTHVNQPKLPRLESIDMMRGLVMALMALDHTRDFFSNVTFFPTDLEKTTAALFLTRWITHYCAPTFVFLTGVSAYLSAVRHTMSPVQLARYLVVRGVWLIVLELTLVRFGWTFNWDMHSLYGGVIWALGWSMVCLAGWVFLPGWAIAGFAVLMIGGHNLFDSFQVADGRVWGWLWVVLHEPGRIDYWPGYSFLVMYPLIPWLAVMAAGYALAPIFLWPTLRRKKALLCLGFLLLTAFFILRLNNIYGDQAWFAQKDGLFTVFAILNCSKYPPSLAYLLMTLGPMLIGLAVFEVCRPKCLGNPLLVFGRVPLLFYLVHLWLIHGSAMIAMQFKGLPSDWLYRSPRFIPQMPTPEYGYGLGGVYMAWLLILLMLYPLCRSYAQFKQRHPGLRWLAYL